MGSQGEDKQKMLEKIGYPSLASLMEETVPHHITLLEDIELDEALTESEALGKLKALPCNSIVIDHAVVNKTVRPTRSAIR